MLTGAGLGNDAWLAQALGEQRLADTIVDLVGAGVIEILALEVDLRAAETLRPAPGMINGARPSDVMLELVFELGHELGIVAVARVLIAQLIKRTDQRFCDEHAAVRTEVAPRVG